MSDTLVIVLNVPTSLNTGDLRRFFTDFVETDKFSMFHYKRRPLAHLIKKAKSQDTTCSPAISTVYDAIVEQCPQHSDFAGTNLALAKISTSQLQQFLDKYHSRPWVGQDEEEMNSHCVVAHLPFTQDFKTLKEFSVGGGGLAPQGNVGTPSGQLREAVRQCRMPSRMIGKLGIGPASGKKGLRYAAVAPPTIEHDNPNGRTMSGKAEGRPSTSRATADRLDQPPPEDTDLGEEWERHECLHDDVNARRALPRAHDSDWADCLEHQPGTKERLFEEEVEVTWDKGSSGLVFYTDAQFWHAQHTSEERNTDDWDVDTSVYYDGTDPDRDSRDMRDMNLPQGARTQSVFTKIQDAPPKSAKRHQSFLQQSGRKRNLLYKNFTKAASDNKVKGNMSSVKQKSAVFKKPRNPPKSGRFAGNSFTRKMMAQQGWKAGEGLGARRSGITDPVDTRGQMTRAGLGYKESEENTLAWNSTNKPSLQSN